MPHRKPWVSVVFLMACAWVLWREEFWVSPVLSATTWHIVEGFEAKVACDQDMDRRVRELSALYPQLGPELLIIPIGSQQLSLNFRCVPDTIDPRPRAK